MAAGSNTWSIDCSQRSVPFVRLMTAVSEKEALQLAPDTNDPLPPLDRCISNPLVRADSELSVLSDTEGAHFVPFGRGHNDVPSKAINIKIAHTNDGIDITQTQAKIPQASSIVATNQTKTNPMNEANEAINKPKRKPTKPPLSYTIARRPQMHTPITMISEPQKQNEMEDNGQKEKCKSEADSFTSSFSSLESANTSIHKIGHFSDDYLKKKAAVQQMQQQVYQQQILLNNLQQRTYPLNQILFSPPPLPIQTSQPISNNMMYNFNPPAAQPQNIQFAERQNVQFTPATEHSNKRNGSDWDGYDWDSYDDGYDWDGYDWDVCWAFNSAKGCRKGSSCGWKHVYY